MITTTPPDELVARRLWPIIGLSALALAAALAVLVSTYSFWGDFEVYRWGVRTWLAGGDFVNARSPVRNPDPLPWVYPPFALLPLAPFALVPSTVGLSALNVLNVLALGATLYLVVRRVWPSAGPRVAFVMAAAGVPPSMLLEPVHACFGQGQINIVLMGAVALDCLARDPRWPRGLLVGIAVAIKLTPAAFLLFFLLRKDFRAAVTATATAAACTAIGFAVDFGASVDYWFRRGPAADVAGHALNSNQSVLGALTRFDLPPIVRNAVFALLCLALLALVVRIVRHADAATSFTAVGLLAVLISPTSWSNHWVWVVPGLFLLFAARRYALGAVTALIAVTAPWHFLPSVGGAELTWAPWQHVVGNSYVLTAVAALVLLTRARRSPARSSGPA
ncbi:glycosyltransferase family 87 protein [Saccharopolyspora taberi]|uniref:glycosyltransferase family 87 protein n=1 Tax=Saccharopolyspora taberi TaxID=60895 RepID=UPI0031DDF302